MNTNETIIAIKGFDPDWKCRGFQYAVGETFTHNGDVVKCAAGGFHAIEGYPLEVFEYYPPTDSVGNINRFAYVECSGEIARDSDDSKIAVSTLKVKAELKIPELVSYTVKWILNRIDNTETNTGYSSVATNTGYNSAATNTGYSSVATNTGYSSAATNTGDRSAATNTGGRSAATNTGGRSVATNTGDRSVATNTGGRSAATNTGGRSVATNTGYNSAATNTGDSSAATNTGYRSVATNTGDRSVATNTGDRSVATNTGDRSVATNTGYRSAASVEGKHSIALAAGADSKAKASEGSWFVVCYRDENNGEIIHAKAFRAGINNVKPDTWYQLNSAGKLVEVKD